MTLHITLIRHGNTDANNQKLFQGHLDTHLNDSGHRQAELVGLRLENTSLDKVYCSDLSRCKETAAWILKHHPDTLVEYRSDLRERSCGSLAGQSITQLMVKSKQQAVPLDQLFEQCGGETEKGFDDRIIAAYQRLVQDAMSEGLQHIAVVTHGGPLRVLCRWWKTEALYALGPQCHEADLNRGHYNTAVSQVQVVDEDGVLKGTILDVNSITHLKDVPKPIIQVQE